MFSRMTSSSVRMAAAMQGSAEFFAPETLMVPSSGLPPRITNLFMWIVYGEGVRKGVMRRVRGEGEGRGRREEGRVSDKERPLR
jgi:hypothetical protein